MNDQIDRMAALDTVRKITVKEVKPGYMLIDKAEVMTELMMMPAAQEDYIDMKREFIRMAEYIDDFLECSDEQRETMQGFVSRLAGHMPWAERRKSC